MARRNRALVDQRSTAANALANSPGAEPVKAAQREPQGSLDGHRFDTLGHAVQDDTAACTACKAAPLCAVVFRYAVTADWGAPWGRTGGRLRARSGGRDAAPDLVFRAAPCLALFVLQVTGRAAALVYLCALRAPGPRSPPAAGRWTFPYLRAARPAHYVIDSSSFTSWQSSSSASASIAAKRETASSPAGCVAA